MRTQMPEPAEYEEEEYEPEPLFGRREAAPGPRILWGRVVVLGAALLLAFFVGRVAAPNGIPQRELDETREELAATRAELRSLQENSEDEIGRLRAQLEAANGGTEAAAPRTSPRPGASPAPRGSPTAAAPAPSGSETREYTVKSGDTLWGIASRFYGDARYADFLAQENDLTDRSKIVVGKKLVIPPKPASLPAAARPSPAPSPSPSR